MSPLKNNKEKLDLDIIIPIFNESAGIFPLWKHLKNSVDPLQLNWRVIFVNDGSIDDTEQQLKRLQKQSPNIEAIHFVKNFGHQSALKAGIVNSKADFVLMMDGDLQHPPSLIPALYEKIREGYDVIQTIRIDQQSDISFYKKITSRLYYTFLSKISGVNLKKGSADFRIITKNVVEVIQKSNLRDTFWRGYFSWMGYSTAYIEYRPNNRAWGTTKYTPSKMLQLAITGLMAFTVSPLRFSIILGIVMAISSLTYLAYAIFISLSSNDVVPGWTSVIAAVTLTSSVQLLVMGILAEYVGKIFYHTSNKPEYLIKRIDEAKTNKQDRTTEETL